VYFYIIRFYSLDVKKSLVWNLQNKTIIENPIIYVVFADHLNCFTEGNFFLNLTFTFCD